MIESKNFDLIQPSKNVMIGVVVQYHLNFQCQWQCSWFGPIHKNFDDAFNTRHSEEASNLTHFCYERTALFFFSKLNIFRLNEWSDVVKYMML